MSFTASYTIRLSETDAAGVVYFAHVAHLCHVAYEDSLLAVGINFNTFTRPSEIALPITHSSVDFFQPLFWGDRVCITLCPQRLQETEFQVTYQVNRESQPQQTVAQALTRHVAIDPLRRQRVPLPSDWLQWLATWGN